MSFKSKFPLLKDKYLIPGVLFVVSFLLLGFSFVQEIINYGWDDPFFLISIAIALMGNALACLYCFILHKSKCSAAFCRVSVAMSILGAVLIGVSVDPYSINFNDIGSMLISSLPMLLCFVLIKRKPSKLLSLIGTIIAVYYVLITSWSAPANWAVFSLWLVENIHMLLAIVRFCWKKSRLWWNKNGDNVKDIAQQGMEEGVHLAKAGIRIGGRLAVKGIQTGGRLAKEGRENFSKWGARPNATTALEQQLVMLKEQFESGSITQEEYEQKRKELLSQL